MYFSASLMSLLVAIPVLAADTQSERSDLLNPWEIHHELRVDASAAPAVRDTFLSFLEYQDLVLFHPKAEVVHLGHTSLTSPIRVEFHKGVGLARYFRLACRADGSDNRGAERLGPLA